MATVQGPLSPHMQIYKWSLSMALSILHRGTGIFLSLGALFLSCWLMAVATGPDSYANISVHVNSWYGKILLLLFSFSLYLHLCNGIRHLFWDCGLGLERTTSQNSAYAVSIASIVLTALTWTIGCYL